MNVRNEAKNRNDLFIRQLKDVISQAERILEGNDFDEGIEDYARYSNELKDYIFEHIDNQQILDLNKEIPYINCKNNYLKVGLILLLPNWLTAFYTEFYIRRKLLSEIKQSRNKFSSIEFLSYLVLTEHDK